MSGHTYPNPLAFETHHSQNTVNDLGALAELRRLLAAKPGVVVMPVKRRGGPAIPETWAIVNGYVQRHCRRIMTRPVKDWLIEDDLVVWGDCRG